MSMCGQNHPLRSRPCCTSNEISNGTNEESFRFVFTDNAYSHDPRIARFREEEKAQKAAQKKAKQDMFRAKKEEEERVSKSL